jgi:hypothetical protein
MFKRKVSVRRPPGAAVRHLFHGVAVKPPEACRCKAVAALEGRRFLSDEAPSLPLAGCDTPHACRCVYEHFNDRRTLVRRDTDSGLPAKEQPADRRLQTARRITDG